MSRAHLDTRKLWFLFTLLMNVRDYYQFIRITNFSAVKTYLSLGLEKRFRVFPFAPVEWFGKWGSLVWDWYCQVFVGETVGRTGTPESVWGPRGGELGPHLGLWAVPGPIPAQDAATRPGRRRGLCRAWATRGAVRSPGHRGRGPMSCSVSCRSGLTLHRSWRRTSRSFRPK